MSGSSVVVASSVESASPAGQPSLSAPPPVVAAGGAAADSRAAPPGCGATHGPLRLAVVGCGTVGRALLRTLPPFLADGTFRLVSVTDRSGTLLDAAGLPVDAVLAAREGDGEAIAPRRRLPWDGATAALLSPVDVVVDVAPSRLDGSVAAGDEPLLAALEAGRDVVTASKAALSLHPAAVLWALRRTGARLRCSASVAGAVPLLELLEGALRGSGVVEVAGAWNTTSTFVLSRVEEGATPAEALEEARRRGYAEGDGGPDLDGRDAAAKACIVAVRAFRRPLALRDVTVTGLDAGVFEGARRATGRGRRTRLVARVTAAGAVVAPETLPEDHPLAAAEGEAAVTVSTRLAGTVALRGPGAGGDATASALLSDLLHLARSRDR